MHLHPSPAILAIAHDGEDIKTADVLFGESRLESWLTSAHEAGYQTWTKPLHEVTRECGAFEPMLCALRDIESGQTDADTKNGAQIYWQDTCNHLRDKARTGILATSQNQPA